MKLKQYMNISAVVTVLFFVFPYNSFTKTIKVEAKSSAKLSYVSGKIFTLQKNKWINLSKGSIIKVNSRIKTEKKSKAEIVFSDGSVVRLSENTDIILVRERENKEHGLLRIFSGKLWANIFKGKSRFSVQGNTAALAVLGTTFNFEAEKNETEISVFEGSVGVQSPSNSNDEFEKKLDNLNLMIDDKNSTKLLKPDKIDKPVEIEKPFKVIEGPHKVSQEEWLEIIANQKITVDNKGSGTISDLTSEEIKEDEWIQWNKELDSHTSENILFNK